MIQVKKKKKLRPDNTENIAEIEYKLTASNPRNFEYTPFKPDTRPIQQNSQLVFLEIPRCSVFILASISK